MGVVNCVDGAVGSVGLNKVQTTNYPSVSDGKKNTYMYVKTFFSMENNLERSILVLL